MKKFLAFVALVAVFSGLLSAQVVKTETGTVARKPAGVQQVNAGTWVGKWKISTVMVNGLTLEQFAAKENGDLAKYKELAFGSVAEFFNGGKCNITRPGMADGNGVGTWTAVTTGGKEVLTLAGPDGSNPVAVNILKRTTKGVSCTATVNGYKFDFTLVSAN
jgi:hypothetical protein